MPRPRVLLCATYPITSPMHGGQRRARAIADAYEGQGWDVRHLAAFPEGTYPDPEHQSVHIRFPQGFVEHLQNQLLRTDLHASTYFDRDEAGRRLLAETIDVFQPDVLHFEQPWLYPAVAKYLQRRSSRPKIVYSSQNVEHDLLRAILETEQHPNTETLVREAEQLERSLVRTADITICVTHGDIRVAESWKARAVCLAPNGASRRPLPPDSPWAEKLQGLSWAFLTGSAHPPNCHGVLEMLGIEFGFVPPDARLVIAGGVVHLLNQTPRARMRSCMLDRRTVRIARPTEDDLNFLLNRASVILLPITQGGGSNIKTAEALLSDRPIVATSAAFRGYEEYRDAPGVIIADDEREFRWAVRDILRRADQIEGFDRQTDVLSWEYRVKDIPGSVARLMAA